MKKINEQKLQSFVIGTMGKRQLSKKEQEHRRKREDETAAAHVFKKFVETFQETPSIGNVWVKAGTYDAGSNHEDAYEKGKLYKPVSKHIGIDSNDKSFGRSVDESKRDCKFSATKKMAEKKKSNLELFKEELRQIQEERHERNKFKKCIFTSNMSTDPVFPMLREVDTSLGSMDNGDPNTTNIYLGNLNPKITESQLMELFGRYGPLASIKIMWPRSEEEKQRGRNCGFVAFMSRLDAERALRCLNGREVMKYEMKLGWGKSVSILNQPIYIPPALVQHIMPPPPSGLPFNAQPQNSLHNFHASKYLPNYNNNEKMQDINSYKCIVKVVIPTDKPLLALVHRMIEYVVREGPMFEAMIMNTEIENPLFRFLFENESPAHIYYRWKLFSLLQGDLTSEWRQDDFRMFSGGAIWKPPASNFYTQGMPDYLIIDKDAPDSMKGTLSTAQRDRLEDLIRNLTPERTKIADCMIFCIEHAEAANEICDCIEESLMNSATAPNRKIARLYLISDLLHNCTVKVSNASYYRKLFEGHMEQIFMNLNASFMALESRLKAEGFKFRVLQVCQAWDEWTVYNTEFLSKLKRIFLGFEMSDEKFSLDIDGTALSADEKDEYLDGVPLDGAALLKSAMMRGLPSAVSTSNSLIPELSSSKIRLLGHEKQDNQSNENIDFNDDIDGIPVCEDLDGLLLCDRFTSGNLSKNKSTGVFLPSKWETVDPNQIESQAITTSKWDTLAKDSPLPILPDCKISGTDSRINIKKQLRSREIELKLVEYKDQLESGERNLKIGFTMSQQIEHYRRKLKRKGCDLEITETDSSIGLSPKSKSKKFKSVRSRICNNDDLPTLPFFNRSRRSRSTDSSPSIRHDKSP